MDIGADTSSQEIVDAFTTGAGEVKYFRWCSKEGSDQRLALVEFTDYGAIPAAMRLNNTVLGESTIKVDHQFTCYLRMFLKTCFMFRFTTAAKRLPNPRPRVMRQRSRKSKRP